MKIFKTLFVHSVLLACSHFAFCQHTFSICAVDTATGEAGSAGASCIANSVIISDVHPGVGVIHTQAAYNSGNQAIGRNLMNAGLTPDQIIDSLINGDFFFGANDRQYGVVGLYNGLPLADAYTGDSCFDYKNHIIGPYYTIQGNILLGQRILDSMETRFLNAEGDLACRLMAALQGANVTGADTRCAASGNSSLSSFLRVAKPVDSPNNPYINLIINSGPAGFEPIDSLQELFDQLQSCVTDTSDTTGTGIFERNDFDVKVFANPADGKISIIGNLPDDARLQILDNMGREMFSGKIGSREINIGLLPKGIYWWRLAKGDTCLSAGKIYY